MDANQTWCAVLLQVLPPDQQLRLRKRPRKPRSTGQRKRQPCGEEDSATESEGASEDSDDELAGRAGGKTGLSLGRVQLTAAMTAAVAPIVSGLAKQHQQQAAFNQAAAAALAAMQRDIQQLGSTRQAASGASSQGVSFEDAPTMAGQCTLRGRAAVQLHRRELLMQQVGPVPATAAVPQQALQQQQPDQTVSHEDPQDSLMLLAAAATPEMLGPPAGGTANAAPSSSNNSHNNNTASSIYCCVIKGRLDKQRAELVQVQLPRPVNRQWRIPNAAHTPQERRTPQWLQWHGRQLGGETPGPEIAMCPRRM
jgi:hypothetical protein